MGNNNSNSNRSEKSSAAGWTEEAAFFYIPTYEYITSLGGRELERFEIKAFNKSSAASNN